MREEIYTSKARREDFAFFSFVLAFLILIVIIPSLLLADLDIDPYLYIVVVLICGSLLIWEASRLKGGELIVYSDGIALPKRTWRDVLKGEKNYIDKSRIREIRIVMPEVAIAIETTNGQTALLGREYVGKDWLLLLKALNQLGKVVDENYLNDS